MIIVESVVDGAQSQKLGLQIGDKITKYYGIAIDRESDFVRAINLSKSRRAGSATLEFLRDGKKNEVSLNPLEELGIATKDFSSADLDIKNMNIAPPSRAVSTDYKLGRRMSALLFWVGILLVVGSFVLGINSRIGILGYGYFILIGFTYFGISQLMKAQFDTADNTKRTADLFEEYFRQNNSR